MRCFELALLTLLGCSGVEPPPIDTCVGRCVSDPWTHTIVTEGCLNSRECPTGSTCARGDHRAPAEDTDPPQSTAACGEPQIGQPDGWSCGHCERPGADEELGSCVLPEPSFQDTLALAPLGGEPFDLDRVAGVLAFAAAAPQDAVEVRCALFSSTPDVDTRQGVVEITNFDSAVLAWRQFRVPQGAVFDLLDPANERPVAFPDERCPTVRTRPLVTRVLAGCWAYSETTLIGWTELVVLSAEDAAAAVPDIALSCAAGDDGRSCPIDEGYGTCDEGVCRARCVIDRDCGADRCRQDPGHYVGVCVPPPESGGSR